MADSRRNFLKAAAASTGAIALGGCTSLSQQQ